MRVHLADGEGVPIQLLCEHESLSEHSFVIVGILDDGRGGGVTKHRPHVTFKWLYNCCDHLLVAVEKIQTSLDFFLMVQQILKSLSRDACEIKMTFKALGFCPCLKCCKWAYSHPSAPMLLSDPTHPYISSFLTICLPYCDLHKPMMSSAEDKEWTVNVFVSSSEESNKTYLYTTENGKLTYLHIFSVFTTLSQNHSFTHTRTWAAESGGQTHMHSHKEARACGGQFLAHQ